MLVLPIILAAVSFWATYQHQKNNALVSHTKDVLASIDKVYLSVIAAESSQRGFLLTETETYYKRYQQRRDEALKELNVLHQLTGDNGRQKENWIHLESAVHARFDRLQLLLSSFRAKQIENAALKSELLESTRLMRSIAQATNIMRAEENRLLVVRDREQRSTEKFVNYAFLMAVVVNMALLYWAYQLLKQYSLKRDLAEHQIRRLNSELELRVAERTAELQAANAHLSRSNEDLTRFAYVASHDLQEPLRTIGSYAGLLARRYESELDEQAKKYIGFLVDGAKRMQTLVQDLLAYSRAGTQPLQCIPTTFGKIVDRALANLQATINETKAHISCEQLPDVSADEPKMVMVIQNLIGNAIKFSKPGVVPEINVGCCQTPAEVIISIKDNGIGFEAEYADRIFVIFQRLHSLGVYPGNGIGLAICKRIVEGHGGRIWATTKVNEGSTFFLSLPSVTSPVKRAAQEERHATL